MTCGGRFVRLKVICFIDLVLSPFSKIIEGMFIVVELK